MISLSWTYGAGKQAKGGVKRDPTRREIREALDKVLEGVGSFEINFLEPHHFGPQTLDVASDGGFYLVTLGKEMNDDYVVQSFNGVNFSNSEIEILGDFWPSKVVCRDSKVIIQIIENLLNDGYVSDSLLN